MKKIFKIIAIVSVVLLLSSIALHKWCDKPLQEVAKNDYLLPSDTYRPPLVKIPFVKSAKPPVSKANLPIPKKDVKTTIVVENPVPGARDITLIVDKKGKVYKSKDTPEDAKIEVTQWKPALLAFQNKWGVSLIMESPPELSIALSWDLLRTWKLHFGLDLGARLRDQGFTDAWVGTSIKYEILPNNNLFVSGGYNWVYKTPYIGIMLRF